MSRSNYDKPFYVDVGTSIVAVRCASNHDVILQYDHCWLPQSIKLAEEACDRMNKEAEIGKPRRQCDVGTAEEQDERFRDFCPRFIGGTCTGCELVTCGLSECAIAWAQMPYEAEEGAEHGKA